MKNRTFTGGTEYRNKPENIKKNDIDLFKHEFQKEIFDSYVIDCSNVNLSGKNIINFKKFKFYLKHTYMNRPPFKNIIKFIINFLKLRLKSKIKIDSGVWIINNKSENYFHWMTESLTRVLSYQQLNKKGIILLPDQFNNIEFSSKTLEMLDVEYKIYSNDNLVKVKNLSLTTHTAPAGNYNSKIISELHSKLNKDSKSVSGKRLWLSRKFSDRRFLVNEDDITPLLEDYGIEIIYPEKLTYQEQVETYRKAEFIGGVAGAALANILYMEKNNTVLELRAENDAHNNCHYSLAVALKNKFYYVICEIDRDNNLIINDETLKETLNKIFKN
tara:strand:+ start:1601 stop:2590 length:990 start_codon:yes stop_codon:yes gene_type:complete